MINPEVNTPATPVTPPAQFNAKVSAADLVTLITAVASSGAIALPEGKTLADVTSLNLNIFTAPREDGMVARINGTIK